MEAPLASEPAEVYDQIFRLERNLLAACKSKGPFDPSVRRLRTTIRDSYEALILRDLAFCEAFEVEQALWRLHYREIEGFRLKIRKLFSARDHAQENAASTDRKKRKKESKKEPLQRTLTSFRSFLGEASGFFHGLLIKLKLQHGLASSLGNTDRLPAERDVTEELRRCMVTCHRILIYLGDLARYKELYAIMDTSVRDWSVAANYYKQAAVLWPSSGNPYNQLAVLCTYCANNLTAIYLYCRSLAVIVPFGTAWDNVILLFGKNKQNLAQTGCDGDRMKGEMTMPTNLHGFVIEQDVWSIHKIARCQGKFIMQFIELVRILLLQPSAEELDKGLDAIERNLEQFLCYAISGGKLSKLAGSSPFSLQMITILIFCMHHHLSGQPSSNGDYILSRSLRIALRFCSSLVKVAEHGTWSVFPVTVILMEWLTIQPKALHIICTEKPVGLIFSEFCEKVAAPDLSILGKSMDTSLDSNKQLLQGDVISSAAMKAQWEDHELLGFVPLANSHLRLDFSLPIPGYGVCNLAVYACWKLRYADALQKLCDVVGQNASGCPASKHIDVRVEDANPTPSLKEWIEKTFFSTDMVSDLAQTKPVEAQCIEEDVHSEDEAVSFTQGCENGSACDVQMSPKSHGELVLCGSTTKVVVGSDDSFEHGRGTGQPTVLTVLKLGENSVLTANLVKGENTPKSNSKAEVRDSCRSSKPPRFVVPSGFLIQSLARADTNNKIPDMDKETSLSLGTRGRSLSVLGSRTGTILHNHAPLSSVLSFDNLTHVKPSGFIEASSILKLRNSLDSFFKNDFEAWTLNGLPTLEKNAYETENPFVLRLRRMSRCKFPAS